jgi:predicted HTH domain antitoxin
MKGMINIEYPESLANTLRLNEKDFAAEIKKSSMVKLYELGRVSSGVAARVLGLSRLDFLELLVTHGFIFHLRCTKRLKQEKEKDITKIYLKLIG